MTGRDAAANVSLGVVTGAHGLRGELRVKLWNPESGVLAAQDTLILRGPGDRPERRVRLDGLRPHGGGVLVFLREVCDRDAALGLRGAELCVPRSALPAPEPDEFYLVDLKGLHVRRPDGTPVGHVEDAFAYPAAEVARVRTGEGVLELPLLPPYLVEVRLDEGELIADELEDLELEKE